MTTSDWSDFTVRIYEEVIRIDFKQDPRIDDPGKKLIAMLEKAGFEQEVRRTEWVRSRTDFWVEQCAKLAQKFGANFVEAPNITPEPPNISDPLQQMQEQMVAMQAELLRLREEVEELKKSEPSDD
jgi:hypothetical protein